MTSRLAATQEIPVISDAELMASQGGYVGGLPHSYDDRCELDETQELPCIND